MACSRCSPGRHSDVPCDVVVGEQLGQDTEHQEYQWVPDDHVAYCIQHLNPRQVLRLPRLVRIEVVHVNLLQAHGAHVLLAHDGPAPYAQLVEAVLARQLPHRLAKSLFAQV
eukprot:GHRQ01019958.1.p1 GENE.GHRQ01019958.1~~GHRQ01019958.1.p1  ORF type:complete len:112 (-),score=0.81 GHRQ01019958.1:154-489(-)